MDWGADPSAAHGGSREPALDPLVDSVERAITLLQESDPGTLHAEALGERVVRVETLLARLAAHEVDCVAVADSRGDARALGFRSTQSWLRAIARLAPGAAKGLVALARRIGECATTRESLAAGRIGLRHAAVLARAVEEITPRLSELDDAARLEKDLVDVAERTDPLRLSTACRRLRIASSPEQATADDWVAFEQRTLSLSRSFGGLGVIDGTLDPLGTETVMSAIHAFSRPHGGEDSRTPGQRRADALTEICRRVLAVADAPTSGGERPQVMAMVPLETLEQRVGAEIGELAWAGPVSGELLRRVACDAAVTRVITDGASQPLDVGRSTRVVPAGLRKALTLRDRHCRYPNCDIPAMWCDSHHMQHWATGGPTALHNLVSVCGFHHTRLHLAGEWIKLSADGIVELIRDPHPDHHDAEHGPAP